MRTSTVIIWSFAAAFFLLQAALPLGAAVGPVGPGGVIALAPRPAPPCISIGQALADTRSAAAERHDMLVHDLRSEGTRQVLAAWVWGEATAVEMVFLYGCLAVIRSAPAPPS